MAQSVAPTKQLPFVGREAELAQWQEILADPSGQSVLVTGPAGIGKTSLMHRMAEVAAERADLSCAHLRYTLTPTDTPDSIMEQMLGDASDVVSSPAKLSEDALRRQDQWRRLIETLGVSDPENVLRRDPRQTASVGFLNMLMRISEHMVTDARLIIFLDADQYHQKGRSDAWWSVIADLPPLVKFVISHRPDSPLAIDIDELQNVYQFRLSGLTLNDTNYLIAAMTSELSAPADDVRQAVKRYDGHP